MKRTNIAGIVTPCGLLVFAFGLVAGCDDPLVDPQTVIGLRVLAAQTSAVDDPSRASLMPDEPAHLRWLVVSNEVESFTSTLALCRAEPTTLGVPVCQGPVLFSEVRPGDTQSVLAFEFNVPEALSADDEWLAFLGLCSDGAPEFDAASSAFDCGSEQALVAFYRSSLVSPDAVEQQSPDVNHNPDLDRSELLINGKEWTPPLLPQEPGSACGEVSLPRVKRGKGFSIDLQLANDDREALTEEGYGSNQRESLVFVQAATQAGLERALFAIDYDSDKREIGNEFDAPKELRVDHDGTRVGFYLTVNDERGGQAWLSREFCIDP